MKKQTVLINKLEISSFVTTLTRNDTRKLEAGSSVPCFTDCPNGGNC